MKPADFPESNKILTAPEGQEKEVSDLVCFAGEDVEGSPVLISSWRPSWRERIALVFGARIWLHIWTSQGTHSPISLGTRRPWPTWPTSWLGPRSWVRR